MSAFNKTKKSPEHKAEEEKQVLQDKKILDGTPAERGIRVRDPKTGKPIVPNNTPSK